MHRQFGIQRSLYDFKLFIQFGTPGRIHSLFFGDHTEIMFEQSQGAQEVVERLLVLAFFGVVPMLCRFHETTTEGPKRNKPDNVRHVF